MARRLLEEEIKEYEIELRKERFEEKYGNIEFKRDRYKGASRDIIYDLYKVNQYIDSNKIYSIEDYPYIIDIEENMVVDRIVKDRYPVACTRVHIMDKDNLDCITVRFRVTLDNVLRHEYIQDMYALNNTDYMDMSRKTIKFMKNYYTENLYDYRYGRLQNLDHDARVNAKAYDKIVDLYNNMDDFLSYYFLDHKDRIENMTQIYTDKFKMFKRIRALVVRSEIKCYESYYCDFFISSCLMNKELKEYSVDDGLQILMD